MKILQEKEILARLKADLRWSLRVNDIPIKEEEDFTLNFCKYIGELNTNEKFMAQAIIINPYVFQYASEELRAKREFVLMALKNGVDSKWYYYPEYSIADFIELFFFTDDLRDDKEIALLAVSCFHICYRCPLQFVSLRLRDDEEVVFKAVETNGKNIHFASHRLSTKYEILSMAIRGPRGLNKEEIKKFITAEMRNDKTVMMEVVKKAGTTLEIASPLLQDDEDIITEAIKKSPSAMKYASDRLKGDHNFVYKSVNQNGNVIFDVNKRFLQDMELLSLAIKNLSITAINKLVKLSPDAFTLLPSEIQEKIKPATNEEVSQYRFDISEIPREELKEHFIAVISGLTPREQKVIRLLYGIDDGQEKTLDEVGREFKVTRERIRQIEAKAIRKLRSPGRVNRLKDFLEDGDISFGNFSADEEIEFDENSLFNDD